MRYQVAVKALLQRAEAEKDAFLTNLPPTLARQLASSTLKLSQYFSMAWSEEISGTKRVYYDRPAVSSFNDLCELSYTRWGSLADQIPALVLHLELSRRQTEKMRYGIVRRAFWKSLMYNAALKGTSPQILGLNRALTLSLLPRDLRLLTTIELIAAFVTLTPVKVAWEDGRRKEDWVLCVPRSATAATIRRNAEVAEVVGRLPRSLRKHFAIQDDTALLAQIVDEFCRRLPPPGQSFEGDYVKTLVEGQHDAAGQLVSPTRAVTMAHMMHVSSTTHVTREEFITFLTKLVLLEGKARRWQQAHKVVEKCSPHGKAERVKERHFYSPASAAAIAHGLNTLCLVTNVEAVVAARPLEVPEWMFLLTVGTSPESEWAAAVLPALSRTLHVADAQRRRHHSPEGESDTVASLFPLESEHQRMWMLRLYLGGLFAIRGDDVALSRAIGASTPLLWEYVRQLRRSTDVPLTELLTTLNLTQMLWIVTRCFWMLENVEKSSSQDPHHHTKGNDGDEKSEGGATALPRAPDVSSELNVNEVREALAAIIDSLGDCINRDAASYYAVGAAPHTTVPAQSTNTPSTPKLGSGFARTQRRPPPEPRSQPTSSNADFYAIVHQLLEDARIACWSSTLESRSSTAPARRAAVAAVLLNLPQMSNTQSTLLERVRAGVTEVVGLGAHARVGGALYDNADDTANAPSALFRAADSFLHRAAMLVSLSTALLRLTDEEALTSEQRATVVAHVTNTVRQITAFVLVEKEAGHVHRRLARLVHTVLASYCSVLLPAFAKQAGTQDTSNDADETRRAMQQLACACLETLDHASSSSSSSASPPDELQRETSKAYGQLANSAVELGMAAGLTSEELPHRVSTVHCMLSTLGSPSAPSHRSPATTTDDRVDAADHGKALLTFSSALARLLSHGLLDEDSLDEATQALRRCGAEELVRTMSPVVRCTFLLHIRSSTRVLATRFSTSRGSRVLLKQILVVAARMSSERRAYDGKRDTGVDEGATLSTVHPQLVQAILMWQLVSTVVGIAMLTPAEDKCIQALLQFVNRHCVVPTCPGVTVPPSPASVEFLDHCEEIFRGAKGQESWVLHHASPRTLEEVVAVSNLLIRHFSSSARRTYLRILGELQNSPLSATRARWQAHMEMYTTVTNRFQGVLAPTAWNRALRDCVLIHSILSFPKLFTPTMQKTLTNALERVLLYSEVHHNTGSWWSVPSRALSGEDADATPEDAEVGDTPDGQLISYQTAARYLAFQEHLNDVDRRIYLVELTHRLVMEMEDIEGSNAAPPSPVNGAASVADERACGDNIALRRGRNSLIWSFRKLRI